MIAYLHGIVFFMYESTPMRSTFLLALPLLALTACQPNNGPSTANTAAAADTTHKTTLNGTYRLVSDLIITKGDTQHVFPVANQEMIKMFNGTHFAFFKHDLAKGSGKDAIFEAGQGSFTLQGKQYAEHLAFCSAREWEDHDFNNFTLEVHGDTLVQQGIEKIDSLHIDHVIVETYVKVP